MDHHVPVRVERPLDVPLEDAYRWLTDYEAADADRAGAVVDAREVLEDGADVVRLRAATTVLGERGEALADVHLHPPSRWECHVLEGDGRGSVYEYTLEEDGAGGCTLHVTYNIYVHRWRSRLKVLLARPLIRWQLNRMWDGFVSSMREELEREAFTPASP